MSLQYKLIPQFIVRQMTNQKIWIKKHLTDSSTVGDIRKFFFQGKVFLFPKQDFRNRQVIAIFLLIGIAVIHTVSVETNVSSNSEETLFQNIFEFLQTQVQANYLLFWLLLMNNFIWVLSISVQLIFRFEIFGLSWLTRRVVEHSIFIAQLDLALSAFMTAIVWEQYLALLILSSLLSIFQATYLQNSSIRSDPFYTSSALNYLIFKFLMVVIYFGNVTFLILGMEFEFYLFHTFIGIFHFVWYTKKGHRLFIHKYPQTFFFILNVTFFTFDVILMEKLIIGRSGIRQSQIFKIFLIFSVLTFTLQIKFSHILKDLSFISTTSPKEVDLFIKHVFEMRNQELDADIESQLIGIIQIHQKTDCIDRQKLRKMIYDPFLKTNVRRQDLFIQKQTVVLFYLKDLYQKCCDNKEKSAEYYIDFCEFICNQHTDMYLALKLLYQARLYPLSLIQKVRISALQKLIVNQNEKLNNFLYDGVLAIQHIIEAEYCYSLIEGDIIQYVSKNITLWKKIRDQQIDQAQLKGKLIQNFTILKYLEGLWKQLGQFLTVNMEWRFIYMYYQLLIRNERIKQKELILLGKKAQQNGSILYFDSKYAKENELINPAIMFQFDSGCITATLQAEQLIIRRISNRFSIMSGYSESQIIGSRVELLMTPDLVPTHSQKFGLWLKDGYISNSQSYKIRFTSFVGKDGDIFPAVKYFKVCLHPQAGLQFVCLLKLNQKTDLEVIKLSYMKTKIFDIRQNYKRLKENFLGDQITNNQCVQIKSNIFLKQEALLPNPTFKQIQNFGLLSRIFIIIILVSTVALSEIIQTDSISLHDYGNQFITIMSLYRFPIAIATTYMKKILNVGANSDSYIRKVTNDLLSMSSSKPAKLTLFDKDLNPDIVYYPYYNSSFLDNRGLSSIDLFNTIVSTVSSFSTSFGSIEGPEFQRFNSYIKPAYDTMMNSTKYNIQETFLTILRNSVKIQITFVVAQTFIFIIIIVLLLFLIRKFAKRMDNILQIALDFIPTQAEDVRQYWKKVDKSFNTLFLRPHLHRNSSNQFLAIKSSLKTSSKSQNKSNQLHPKKRKTLSWKRYDIILQILAVFGLAGVIFPTIFTQMNMVDSFNQLESFESAGFFFLKYFPCGSLVTYGCTERYYSNHYPTAIDFDPRRYADSLLATYSLGYEYNYIGSAIDSSSEYYAKQKNYFFGNPCEYNPSILVPFNITSQTCNTICNTTFQRGISSFLRYSYTLGSKYINDQISMTAIQLEEFMIGTSIHTIYIFDAIKTWTKQFTQSVQSVQANNLNTSIIIIVIAVIIHFIINQYVIMRKLNSEYEFVKRAYMNMIPETILVKEKIVLHKFVIEGIVKA